MKTYYKREGRPVVGFNPTTYEMVNYNKSSDAVKDGFTQSCISKCCITGEGTHKGFKWMFLDEHEEATLWLG